jgi:hypothetical protein
LASPTERRRNFTSRIGSHTTFGGRRSGGAFSPPHFPSHRATGNTQEFQHLRSDSPLCLGALPPSLPLMSPFGLPCGRLPSQRPLACVRERPTPSRLHGRDDHAPLPSC